MTETTMLFALLAVFAIGYALGRRRNRRDLRAMEAMIEDLEYALGGGDRP